jgi:hypothetical protein
MTALSDERRAMNPNNPFWAGHEWWARRGDAEVSLHDLVGRFANLTDRGDAHQAMFARELQCWIRLICECGWVRDEIGAGTAMLATQGVRSPFRNSAAWEAISVLLGKYGDSLTLLSLSFYEDAHARRPSVEVKHSSPIRERARSVAKAVRGALVSPSRPGGSILESRNSLEDFLAGVARQRVDLRASAMQAYAEGLLDYANAANDPPLASAIDEAVDDLAAEFGFSSEPLKAAARKPVQDFRGQATSLVFAAALRKPELQDKDDYDKAIDRAIDRVNTRLRAGDPIPNADYALARAAKDIETERWRPKSMTEITASSEDINAAAADPRHASRDFQMAQAQIDQRDLLEGAIGYLQGVRIVARIGAELEPRSLTEFWEKTTAVAIMANRTELIALDRPSVRRVVIDRWLQNARRPNDAVCATRVHAATFVQSLLKLAVAHALPDVTVFPDWIGRGESSHEWWVDRIAAVDAVLAANRQRTPQDEFNEVHQKGEPK